MNPCVDCLHYTECFERRGRCTEYKDLEGVRREIEMLNQKERVAAIPTDSHEDGKK